MPDAVAIVGGGPAGKSAARELRAAGIPVTIFDKESELGGLMRHGYPAYRMPDAVTDRDNRRLAELGVEIRTGRAFGDDLTLAELEAEFAAIILAIGAPRASRLGIPGEKLDGVYHALDFLYRARRGAAPALGSRVVVIGGGDTAADAAVTAQNLGAGAVTIAYRGPAEDLRIQDHERARAERSGIAFRFEAEPREIVRDDDGLTVRFADGAAETAHAVIVAVGQERDHDFLESLGLTVHNPHGTTDRPHVFVAGGTLYGSDRLANAILDGRRAAGQIIGFLNRR